MIAFKVWERYRLKRNQEEQVADVAIAVESLLEPLKITRWTTNRNVQSQMRRALGDYLYELERRQGLMLATEEPDCLIDQIVEVGRARERRG